MHPGVAWAPKKFFISAPIESWNSGDETNDNDRTFTLYKMAPTIVPNDERWSYHTADGEHNYQGRGDGPF
jgi:hypothetical protein